MRRTTNRALMGRELTLHTKDRHTSTAVDRYQCCTLVQYSGVVDSAQHPVPS